MNRTITMNLSGIIFHIEEDAYEKLNKYLSTIRGYFHDSESRDEIMSDIESRIAEMLQDKVSKTKQAVLMMDVENVMAIMGKPEDFAGETQQTESKKEKSESNATSYPNNKRRRVFRDTDDKVIGGVCSGIANYFGFDPVWLRGAFAISFFVFGSGLLLYIILMIILPKAKTTAEKLEMRGEKVDVNNIGKVVNEEFEDFKKRMKDFGEDVGSRENKDRIKSSAQKAMDFTGDVFHQMLKVAGKIIASIAVFLGVLLLVGLLATIFGKGTLSVFNTPGNNIHFSLYELCTAVLPDNLPIWVVVLTILLFIGVPLMLVIYKGIKLLFGIKTKNKIVRYTANGLWICGWIMMFTVASIIGSDFSEQASVKQSLYVRQPEKMLSLDVNPLQDEDMDVTYNHHHHNINFGDWTLVSKENDRLRLAYPTMDIIPSENDNFQLTVIKSANGYDKRDAAMRARNIDYMVEQTDSTIHFNSYFDVKNMDKLRAQDVRIILKVPVNKIVYLSKRMEKIIFDIDNVNDALDSDMVGRRWIMTRQGLRCIDCNGLDDVQALSPPPAPPAPPKIDSASKF